MNRTINHQNNLMILTGGRSRRMGSDKSTLPFGRYTVIEYMVLNFAPYFDHIYISDADAKRHQYDSMVFDYYKDKVSLVYDEVADAGPLGGLYSVLTKTDVQDLFVVAVDMPFAAPDHLLTMASAADCCVAVHQGHKEPLFGWYHRRCLTVIENMIQNKKYKLGLLHEQVHTELREEEPWQLLGNQKMTEFFNMNTREDYYQALDLVRYEEEKLPCVSFAGWSGTGKTTYIEQVIPKLLDRGMRVAVIKHDGHDFEMDQKGKDTWRYKAAGASEIIIASADKYAKICDTEDAKTLDELVRQVDDVDLIIVEGFKFGSQPKVLLKRDGANALDIDQLVNVIAVVSDSEEEDVEVPCFEWEDFDGIAEFITNYMLDIKASDDVDAFLENL